MPADYGRLTAAEKARLARARRRAGVVKPPKPIRDTRTVSNVRAETAAREKAKRDFPTPQSLASPAGIRRLQEVTARNQLTGRERRGVAAAIAAQPRTPTVRPANVKPMSEREQREVRANVIANAALKQIRPQVRESIRRAPGPGVSGQAFLETALGPHLASLIPGGKSEVDTTAKGLALDVGLLLPGTLFRAGRVGVRAAKAAGRSDPLVRMSGKTRVPKPPAQRTLKGQEPRMVRYGDLETQFPNSPSLGTRYAQRLLDRGSETIGKGADVLRDSDSRFARAAGAVITPVSARARVPKQTGKLRKKESTRRAADKQQAIRDIREVGRIFPGLRAEPTRMATWYFAQLPKSHRNAEGLQLVKAKHEETLQDLVSGAFSQRVSGAIRTLQESMNEATGVDRFQALGDLEELRALQADIPDRIKDVTQEVTKLGKTIERLPHMPIREEPIEAMRVLMDDRRDILTRAGKLNPETADARTGLVSRWLGLEPDGTEVFVGHRMDRVKRQRPSGMPAAVSLGKSMLPEGVAQQNTGQLLMTGRARKDLMSVIEDWQAAQVYEVHNLAKDELAKMGEAVIGRPKAGYMVVNPKGHTLPRTWQVDDTARAAAEGFDPEDVLIRDTADYLNNYLAEGNAAITEMLQKAAQAGHLEDLRQVPVDVVKRYYSQILPTKIHAATPGVKEGAGVIGKGVDWLNDVVYGSLIYSNPGYIPANIVANEIMAVAQQGVLHPGNLSRSVQLIGSGLAGRQARVRDLIRAEVGAGMTASIASDTSPLRKGADVISEVADEPFRFSSFMHEAARVGVIAKAKPVLNEADYAKLEEFLTDPKHRVLLNDVSDRAVQAMIDFGRLGSKERAFAKRALFVWGFLRGALRYPGRFALDHPIRTAAGGTAAYLGQDAIRDATVDDLPARMRGTVGVSETQVDGKTYPTVLQTRSFEPTNPPSELIGTAIGDKDARTFLEMAHPGLQAVARVAGRKDRFGFDAASYPESIGENVKGLFPWYDRARDYIDPEANPDPLYPEDATRLGRLKRDIRVLPVAIDPEVGAEKRRRELSRQGRGVPKSFPDRRTEMVREELKNARKLGLNALTPEVREAVKRKAAIETYTDRLERQQRERQDVQTPEGKKFKLTAKQKAAAALMGLRDTLPADVFDYRFAKTHLDSLQTARDTEQYLDLVRREAYGTVLEDWHRHANAAAG